MHPGLWLLLGVAALALYRESDHVKQTVHQAQMTALITRIAVKHGVPVPVALAFAWLESRFNPTAEGDLQWAFKRPDKYRELVLNAARFKDNPWRTDADRWHSYGLFQLLAPYHSLADEDPRKLLDPEVNAERGIKTIANLLKKHDGDPVRARLAFAGALNLGPDTQLALTKRLHDALERFQEGVA